MATPKTTWDIIKSEGYLTLKLNGAFDDEAAKKLDQECKSKLIEDPPIDVVVNCQNASEFSMGMVRFFMQVVRDLKTHNKQIRFILVNDIIKKFLIQNGVNEALPVRPSLREALFDFGLATKQALDVNFINPFLIGTMNALKIQASTEAKPGKIFKQEDKNAKFSGDISGVIGLVSEAFNGSVVISFPEATFLGIMSRMLGEECKEITKDIQDGAGELTNIIFGQAKVILNEKGYALKTAIPSVVSGKDHSVQSISNGPRVVVPFTTDVGDFCIEICISG